MMEIIHFVWLPMEITFELKYKTLLCIPCCSNTGLIGTLCFIKYILIHLSESVNLSCFYNCIELFLSLYILNVFLMLLINLKT